MKILNLSSKYGLCNSFLITQDDKQGILIDCASPDLVERVRDLGVKVSTVLLTHGHFDHVGGCRAFSENSASIYCGEQEKHLIFSKEFLNIFGGVHVPQFEISRSFRDGEEFELCGLNIKVISTPGHTEGSVCYIIGDCIFTGDTLFCGSVGRWDLPTGNFEKLANSLEKIKNFKGDYKLFCGHGENSTLEQERKYNPYLK